MQNHESKSTVASGVKFSIITPTYNRADIISESLDSVLREVQSTGLSVEAIVVDDHSTDSTETRVSEWIRSNGIDWVRYVRLPKNRGVTGAKNVGIDLARGEFLIFLDSDDQLLPGAMNRIHDHFIRHPEIGLYFGGIRTKSGLGKEQLATPDVINRAIDYPSFLRVRHFGEFLAACRRSILDDPKLRYVEELRGFEGVLWTRLLREGVKMWVDPTPVRLYDDLRTDRFCHLANIRKDGVRLFRGSIFFMKEFAEDLKRLSPESFDSALKRLSLYSKLADERNPEVVGFIRSHLKDASLGTALLEYAPDFVAVRAYQLMSKIRVWRRYGLNFKKPFPEPQTKPGTSISPRAQPGGSSSH